MADIKHRGLKKRQSYGEIVDYLLNKQEKIKYPNRLAKQLRNSNQLSNLLDGNGEGLINMELQQQNIIKAQQKEMAINAMADANSTAKVLKIASTKKNVLKQSGSRTQTQFYGIAQEDKVEQLSNYIEMESEKNNQSKLKNKERLIWSIFYRHI